MTTPLDKDLLVATESIPSLSPPSTMSESIKRPPRTYGRPRDTASGAGESTSSLQPSKPSLNPASAISSLYTSRMSEKMATRPTLSRQSPRPDVAEGQNSDGEDNDASDVFQWGWKAKLKEMDEDDADVDYSVELDAQDASHGTANPARSPTITSNDDASRTVPNSPSLVQFSPMAEDVFGGTVPTVTASSATIETIEDQSPPISPQPIRRRVKNRAIVDSSGEDSDGDTKSISRKSPAALYPITTPKSRSSPTPPTSDDDMPAQIVSASRSKGKGKPLSSRMQVPALRFDEPIANHRNRISEVNATHNRSKLKAPTKKDRVETARDRGRIAGAQRAAVKYAEPSGSRNLQNFFVMLKSDAAGLARTSSDDPISSFSSSPGGNHNREASMLIDSVNNVASTPLPETIIPVTAELRPLEESDDENLPAIGDILNGVMQEKTQAEKQRLLLARKLQLAGAVRPVAFSDSDNDDLEITGVKKTTKDIVAELGSAHKQRPSEGRKRQLAMGGISLAQQKAKQREQHTPPTLTGGRLTHNQLTKHLAQKVVQENTLLTKQKEDEWVRRGGQIAALGGDAGETAALKSAKIQEYAEQGQRNAEAREARMQVDEEDDDDGSDGNWSETRGTSPQPEDNNASGEDADITMVNDEGLNDDDDEENQAPGQIKARGLRRVLTVIDSDSENEENAPPVKRSASFIFRESLLDHDEDQSVSPVEGLGAALHRGSASSTDERTEDEGDKENDTHLMYDRSDDKENKAVPRHPVGARPALGRQGSSLFGLVEGIQRGLSMSPGDRLPVGDGSDEENENDAGGDRRRPLQNLLPDADPFSAEVGPSASVDFAARLKQASPLPGQSTTASQSTLLQSSFEAPVKVGTKALGFSQRSSEDAVAGFKGAALQPGFSDLFETGTEQQRPPKRPLGLSPSFSEKSQTGLLGLRKNTVSLDLTQDLDLQPAFEVGGQLKRQADVIFEKEQEYLWETANKKLEAKKQELYVNDQGFLTQTRPDVEEPEIYQPSSPTQHEGQFLGPGSALRRPLRTLSLTESEFDAPEKSPLRRLARRNNTSASARSSSSPSPTRARGPTNAFDLLRREKIGIRAPRPRKPLEKSEFVAEEAQESDDDEMLGFGHKGEDGDEEDGEDMDRTLETLVDDKEMDATAVAEARVREKYQEHAHEDDLANERLHQAAVQGELRKKRRNRGLGIDDSDEEDEEEENRLRKMRRGLNEPMISGKISELAKDPSTEAFFRVYQESVQFSDDPELAYLQETQPEEAQDVDMESDDEENRVDRVITQRELTERLREAARQEEHEPALDVNDLSWMEREDSDGENQTVVRAINLRAGPARKAIDAIADERLQRWAKTEGRSRNVGTGRASGRNAVTGQVAKAKSGGGSLRAGLQRSEKPAEARRPVKAQPSVLVGVASDRSSRFL
ncbi:hypothetical protein C8R43DRAFT_1123248 [Mycena crocata]|nr:hypothetical protein C8R43DRAFT_1123248 [Mycena crocata]